MSGIVTTSINDFFRQELTRRNWVTKKLDGFHFQIGDWAILRITKRELRETPKDELLIRKLMSLAKNPNRRLLILEGEISEFFLRRSRSSFHLEFSIDKYLNYNKFLKLALVKYGVNVIQTFNMNMTLNILLDLTEEAHPLEIDFNQFNDPIYGLQRNKFFTLVTYLSAYFGKPFSQLSTQEILKGLDIVKMPGIGIRTLEDIKSRLSRSVLVNSP